MLSLNAEQRRALKARAHSLNPVVSISQNGLSDAVLKEIDASLKSHELIKVRVYNDNREEREQFLQEICQRLDAAPVQHIGKLLVIWRQTLDENGNPVNTGAPQRGRPRAAPRRTKRSFQA